MHSNNNNNTVEENNNTMTQQKEKVIISSSSTLSLGTTTSCCVEEVSTRRREYNDEDFSSSFNDDQHRHNYIRELLYKPVILSTSPVQNNFVTAVVANNNNTTTPPSSSTTSIPTNVNSSSLSSYSKTNDHDDISSIRQHQLQHQQQSQQRQEQQRQNNQAQTHTNHNQQTTHNHNNNDSRTTEAMKQLLCGGIAGSVAKTLTAPLSRLTILFQVHSLVTTKEYRPKFATSLYSGFTKIIERGGIKALYKGNMTSVLHRFPYSAINFYMYENTMDLLASTSNDTNNATTTISTDHTNNTNQSSHNENIATTSTTSTETLSQQQQQQHIVFRKREKEAQTQKQLVRRMTRYVYSDDLNDDDDDDDDSETDHHQHHQPNTNRDSSSSLLSSPLPTNTSHNNHNNHNTNITNHQHNKQYTYKEVDTPAIHKFIAGAVAGTTACTACYPLDLVRTRLTTQLEGQEHYRGIMDAFRKIYYVEGFIGFYSGILPTLLVAVPNFAISYTVYGTLKEYTLDDDLFYNLRKINADSGEKKIGLLLTIICGGLSGILATCITFPMDTIRRRMQIQSVHIVNATDRLSSYQVAQKLIQKEGLLSLYRGITPELLKVIPMVGTMFTVYEYAKEMFQITHERNR